MEGKERITILLSLELYSCPKGKIPYLSVPEDDSRKVIVI
jgi:hypothetical protein